MKTSKNFTDNIKNYLEKRAAEDPLFAETFKKPNKSIEECCNYIVKCAKEGSKAGYSDEEVYGWAVHYYDEDDIKNIKPISAKVIVNQSVELSEEDKAKAKEEAMREAIDEFKMDAKKELSSNIELTEEDISEAKRLAMEKVVEEQKQKVVKKKVAKSEKVDKTETQTETLSLF